LPGQPPMCVIEGTESRLEERQIYRKGLHAPWRGVNLGGWLLLEPGTAKALFKRHAQDGQEATCEWDLAQTLRRRGVVGEMIDHRESFITKQDFQRIQSYGLNAVRLPLGYWIVLGPAEGESYVGPALEYIDRAVSWAEECGLQVLLDLHGCPGGESGDAPCGRHQRPVGTWQWSSWRFDETLRALEVLARRYCTSKVVTGIQVCNEPSHTVPARILCTFYDQAVDVIRRAGMVESQVAIVLPLFQRPAEEIVMEWKEVGGCRHLNVCFDFHYYHCFENEWNGKTFAQQLRSVEEHKEELQQFPAMVGEWSLALGLAARHRCLLDQEARTMFASVQLSAYSEASHGWFFWNWADAHGTDWDWQQSYGEGALSVPSLPLPSWDGIGIDPLEEELDPSPADTVIHYGDGIFLRTFHGRHMDVGGGPRVCARWADRGDWQRFIICASVNQVAGRQGGRRRPVGDGDVICLRAHNDHFVSVSDRGEVVERPKAVTDASADLIVHVEGSGELHHRNTVFLRSRSTSRTLGVDGSGGDVGVRARWRDCGEWQRFVAEKACTRQERPVRTSTPGTTVALLRKRSAESMSSTPCTPPKLRRVSTPLWLDGDEGESLAPKRLVFEGHCPSHADEAPCRNAP